MTFHTLKCHFCGHIWNSSASMIFWINHGCPKCRRHSFISFYEQICPDCNKPLKPKLKVGRYIKHWECTNPECHVISVRYAKDGVKVKRAVVL